MPFRELYSSAEIVPCFLSSISLRVRSAAFIPACSGVVQDFLTGGLDDAACCLEESPQAESVASAATSMMMLGLMMAGAFDEMRRCVNSALCGPLTVGNLGIEITVYGAVHANFHDAGQLYPVAFGSCRAEG